MSTDRFKRPGRILSFSEREGLRREIAREKAYLEDRLDPELARSGDHLAGLPERRRLYVESQSTWDTGMGDSMAVRARIRRKERLLAAGMPDSIGDAERNAIEARGRKHEEFLKSKMLPRRLSGLPYGHPEFSKAVALGVGETSQDFERCANDWKNIQRQLNPDNPMASNLERLRPDN
jgi:hypothetical protein